MPYELVITDARSLKEEVIGFGEDANMAERVMNWTWQGLLSRGYVSLHSTKTPTVVEFVKRRGPAEWYVELRHRPRFDFANALRLIHMLALDRVYPRYFVRGTMQGDVIQSEQAWQQAQYVAHVTEPTGLKLRYALPVERMEAIKAFNTLVRERAANGQMVTRCVDADLKWMALDETGMTTLEFVEVSK